MSKEKKFTLMINLSFLNKFEFQTFPYEFDELKKKIKKKRDGGEVDSKRKTKMNIF